MIVIWRFIIVLGITVSFHVIQSWVQAMRRGIHARKPEASPLPLLTDRPFVWPFTSVIVPAWRERGTIERCIENLRRIEYPTWEIIIVAGGPDGTYEAACKACRDLDHCIVIEQQPKGKNAALNQGMSVARGDIIVLLDADSLVSSDWLQEMVAPIDGVVLATTADFKPLQLTPVTIAEQMERIAAYQIRKETNLQGSSIAIARSALNTIGGFPEDVLVGVDWDMNARAAMHGIRRAVSQKASVLTSRPATLGEYWRNEVRWRRAHLASLFRLHQFFLSQPLTIIQNLYIYILAWVVLVLTICLGIMAIVGTYELRMMSIAMWLIFALWVLLRRAALVAQIACLTREWRWFKFTWTPPVLLVIVFVAIVFATLTVRTKNMHFKGSRFSNLEAM